MENKIEQLLNSLIEKGWIPFGKYNKLYLVEDEKYYFRKDNGIGDNLTLRQIVSKESGTLLGVGTAYLPVKEIKGEFYVKVSDFTRCMDGIRIEQETDRKHIEELEEEIRSLELENRAMKVESEDLKMWLREKLPLALLKEYMEKFEGVDLKNV